MKNLRLVEFQIVVITSFRGDPTTEKNQKVEIMILNLQGLLTILNYVWKTCKFLSSICK